MNLHFLTKLGGCGLCALVLLGILATNQARPQSSESVVRNFDEVFSSGRMLEAFAVAEEKLNTAKQDRQYDPGALAERLVDAGRALIGLRRSVEAIPYIEQALSMSTDSRQRARLSNILATALMGAGKGADAERLLNDLIELQSAAGLSAARELGQNLYDLGNLQRELGRLDAAQLSLQRSLDIRLDLLGDQHPDVAHTLVGLGNVRWQRGEYIGAKELCKRALTILDKPAHADDPRLAAALNNLGSTLVELGKFNDALALHDRALAIREKSLGQENYEVSVSLNNIGNASRELGRLYDAEAVLKRALAIREQWDSPTNPSVATILNNLALVYVAMDRREDAETLYLRATEILQDRPDAGLRGLGQILSNLGRLYLSSGHNEQAKKH